MFVYKPKTGNIPIKVWMPEDAYYSDKGMLEQCENLATLPFAYHHIALLPDGHVGYGMPIGGVMATKGVIVPNAVGVDIGCGMRAVQTGLKELDIETLKKVMGSIRERVPVGYNHHKESQTWDGFNNAPDIPIIQRELKSVAHQIGTLGGGNHFIEIQEDDEGYIWIMIHSGSRNFGFKIAHEYHKKAVKKCEKWCSDIPTKELAFLPIESPIAKEYLEAMNYALEFARANRRYMMNKVKWSFLEHVPIDILLNIKYVSIDMLFDAAIDIHHNYAAWEHHFNKDVIVHRKGAVRMREGEIGIIPGSQGTSSYIVKGKGNSDSFNSCSHGAGRRMGRKQACNELNFNDEVKKLATQRILHSIRGKNDLDEASGAYKDIDKVMAAQSELVDIVVKLTPMGVIKG